MMRHVTQNMSFFFSLSQSEEKCLKNVEKFSLFHWFYRQILFDLERKREKYFIGRFKKQIMIGLEQNFSRYICLLSAARL